VTKTNLPGYPRNRAFHTGSSKRHFSARQLCLARYISQICPSVRLSVCLTVTRVDQSKTVEVGIMQFSPYSSLIRLVFCSISFIHKFRRDPPERGRQRSNKGGLWHWQTSYFLSFYRAKLRVARYCHGMLSVRPSVCLTVCLSVCDVEVS